ncbi:DinB family protein [Brevibacillus porteri]|uniref:Damage-inducible protein DinB n=1 Tax=Brevibacillus porteri TaxID=2126350 RepID=A0ABX5FKE9_9BACL|nr:DinB family protein [Brevibacillus porteri]MED1799458.1 DinB family protein [Brevibacillus porteri]MED2131932.1 DinB family protein [Brevibacillus porteri]MED2744847.1 DinB family protein [Brevibacillus porteri]MED2817345.1 DinB family protein [Brevibacillus porteri]MED2893221.1 DinB family protein [Brevibacillus porteri]
MKMLFKYNWQVRDEWMEWCKQLPPEELLRERTGGAGTILYTLFHIADVEYSWLRGVQGKPDIQVSYADYRSLEKVKALSNAWRVELRDVIENWSDEMENESVKVAWDDEVYTKGELLRHVIAHEIHHMGQLSIWARELGIAPVSANVIGRGLARS